MRRYLPVGLWIGVRAGLDPCNNINNVKRSHHTDEQCPQRQQCVLRWPPHYDVSVVDADSLSGPPSRTLIRKFGLSSLALWYIPLQLFLYENGGTSYVQNELSSHSFSFLILANNLKDLKMLPDLLILSFLSNLIHPHPNLKVKLNLQPKLMLNPTFKLLTLDTIMLIHLGWRRIHPRHLLLPSQSSQQQRQRQQRQMLPPSPSPTTTSTTTTTCLSSITSPCHARARRLPLPKHSLNGTAVAIVIFVRLASLTPLHHAWFAVNPQQSSLEVSPHVDFFHLVNTIEEHPFIQRCKRRIPEFRIESLPSDHMLHSDFQSPHRFLILT